MFFIYRPLSISIVAVSIVVLTVSVSAGGAILHVGDSSLDWAQPALVGSWGGASCIAVWPRYVMLTRHQGGQEGTHVTFGETTYVAERIWSHATADLQVARIAPVDGGQAQLSHWARVARGQDESGRTVLVGGRGKLRGDTCYDDQGQAYAYLWGESTDQVVWGANVVESTYSMTNSSIEHMYLDFDGPELGITGEVAPADGDSGGGWFVRDADGAWRVVGMSRSTQRSGATWFRNPHTGQPDPDRVYALRVASVAEWVRAVINGTTLPGDADADGHVDFSDYVVVARAFGQSYTDWSQGDFTGDGLTNAEDLEILRANWGRHITLDEPTVPEPSILMLLSGGALILARRR